ncbi:MAG: PfkB family carbohydrate kinase [Propionibacteriaceae bacterium]|jgi:sugar/nucleoside kinase (ribokinase family)|nr:PfkB family carbohydrate kinase [Propionibacteriaceae bacterium]
MTDFDTVVVGQVSRDINTDYQGHTVYELGGAVVYSSYAAAALGHRVCAVPKADPTIDAVELFAANPAITVHPVASPTSTSIENVYHTADKERRTCRCLSRIASYAPADLPDVTSPLWHLAGLMFGDVPDTLIPVVAERGAVAVDVQGLLRHAHPDGSMTFLDWENKRDYLPLIKFLKTDSAEAEILTGLTDRAKAAEQLVAWGAAEVMITHSSEVLAFDGDTMATQPLKPRNLSGRSGRGDTCFSGYITERLSHPLDEALLMAAALVSLKMEKVGPFEGTRQDVAAYIADFY